ncbi:collagen-like protein (plasmid) [Bacillus mycoides]|uniref:collagen-like protein n=1 Tax=Bacillus mycoides TaxID=1405 RepID=UPI001C033525|nr:collagen-like protein [Bacillus mycoides]QWH04018.1 collagen-like protein [Bacillus mycoides]
MSRFKKRFDIPCDCFFPPLPVPEIGPTGPTVEACCPCTNLLDNPGFDEPAIAGDPIPGWKQSGAIEVGPPNVHSGRFLSDGTFSILAASIDAGGNINQIVDVHSGCCYTLSFAANVNKGAFLIASVSFPELGQGCPPASTILGPLNIPHIIPANNQSPPTQPPPPPSFFQEYTLVVCVPSDVTVACIAFQNIAINTGEEPTVAFVDNVVFQPTGGPCTSCFQNF